MNLGLKEQKLSSHEVSEIKNKTKPIHFKNIKEAKQFIYAVSNKFEDTRINLLEKHLQKTVHSKLTKSAMTNRFTIGCGKGSVRLTTGNMSIYLHLNVTFNYDDANVSNVNSNLSGLTIGLSYDHISSNYTVSGNTINFTVQGVMNYNLFVESIGTVYRENVTLRGSYNPCTSGGGIGVCPSS